MGTQCQEIHDHAPTNSAGISAEARRNRKILVDALEAEGMINYPSEWWHFSYGDHQWAFLLGKTEAFYGPLDI
jgi:D-alanyl-D-alanine dipeptidase